MMELFYIFFSAISISCIISMFVFGLVGYFIIYIHFVIFVFVKCYCVLLLFCHFCLFLFLKTTTKHLRNPIRIINYKRMCIFLRMFLFSQFVVIVTLVPIWSLTSLSVASAFFHCTIHVSKKSTRSNGIVSTTKSTRFVSRSNKSSPLLFLVQTESYGLYKKQSTISQPATTLSFETPSGICLGRSPIARTSTNERQTRTTKSIVLWSKPHPSHKDDNKDDERTVARKESEASKSTSSPNTNKFDTYPTSILSSLRSRFISPTIDDPYLPLSDVGTAQIMGPSLQLLYLVLVGGPRPSWCNPYFETSVLYSSSGSLIAPTLIHGAALASCWLLGALAARAYRLEAFQPRRRTTTNNDNSNDTQDLHNEVPETVLPFLGKEWDYSLIFQSIFQAGSFAIGLLILATQIDLFFEFKGRFVQFGESDDIDFRLLLAAVEVTNDIVFEIIVLVTFRLLLAYQYTNTYNQRQ